MELSWLDSECDGCNELEIHDKLSDRSCFWDLAREVTLTNDIFDEF